MEEIPFNGPIFIVGLPRSGTKLLRDLLNSHPRISIPDVESHFIPYLYRKYGSNPNFHNKALFDQFYHDLTNTAFYLNYKEKGKVLQKEEFKKNIQGNNWSSVFEFIFKFFSINEKGDSIIWGDKTPGYINHILFLTEIFPRARFIHIIRDPRDYCLSVNKTWNKNIYRAAHLWKSSIEKTHNSFYLKNNYIEIQYEELLNNPKDTLLNICNYIQIEYSNEMQVLSGNTEKYGDTKGRKEIVRNNQNKFKSQLSKRQIKKIEDIVYPMLIKLGYSSTFSNNYKSLTKFELKLYRIMDGVEALKFHINDKGFFKGLKYSYYLHKKSSWRQ